MFPAIQTRYENRGRFIGASYLQFIICTILRRASLACKETRRALDGGLIATIFALALLVNELSPFLRAHFLVRHECEFLRLDFSRENERNHGLTQVAIDGAQTIFIELLEMTIVPGLDDFAMRGLFDGIVENPDFEVGGHIFLIC